MTKSRGEIVSVLTGSIITITGAFAAINQLTDSITKLHDSLSKTPPLIIWLAIGFLFLIGAVAIWRGLSKKSRLLKGGLERFTLDPDNQKHLIGREDDIRALVEALEYPLIFLEGESGSGKSALLRAGLLPALIEKKGFSPIVPIYINSYGMDWESGLELQVVSKLWGSLTEKQWQQLKIRTPEDLKHRMWPTINNERISVKNSAFSEKKSHNIFADIQSNLGLIPLIIFDQFDDYQAQNRTRFLRKGKWINVEQLTENKTTKNNFWANIRIAIINQSVRCMFVTRNDTFSGLESVRFVDPQVFYLKRLNPSHVSALFEEIMSEQEGETPIILNPECGWNLLKENIVEDLTYQGTILPIQIRIALKGLVRLPYLNVSTYENAGSLEGLEAGYIESGISTASNRTGLSSDIILNILLNFIDHKESDTPKARSCTKTKILTDIDIPEEKCLKILDLFTQKDFGILRISVDSNSEEDDIQWTLYHDYLANAVLSAKRRTERWLQDLRKRLMTWKRAIGWVAKWGALLSPLQLIRTLLISKSKNVQLEGLRSYTIWSTAKLVPYIALFLLVTLGCNYTLNWQARKDAQIILVRLRGVKPGYVPEGESVYQLWRLASGSNRFKKNFIKEAVKDLKSHEALLNAHPYILQSLLGIDPKGTMRNVVLKNLTKKFEKRKWNDLTIFHLIWAMEMYEAGPTDFDNNLSVLYKKALSYFRNATDKKQQELLKEALSAPIKGHLSKAQAASIAGQILNTMKENISYEKFVVLSIIMSSMKEKISDSVATESAKLIISRIEKHKSPHTPYHLYKPLALLMDKDSETHINEVSRFTISAMDRTSAGKSLRHLSVVLKKINNKSTEKMAVEGSEIILTKILEFKPSLSPFPGRSSHNFYDLENALLNLKDRLPEKQMIKIAEQILSKFRNEPDNKNLNNLIGLLASWIDILPEKQVSSLTKVFVSTVKDIPGEKINYFFSPKLKKFKDNLSHAEVETISKIILEKMKYPKNYFELMSLNDKLLSIKNRMTKERILEVASILLSNMRTRTGRFEVANIGEALGGYEPHLPVEHASIASAILIENMESPTNEAPDIFVYSRALGLLKGNLPIAEAKRVVMIITTRMEKSTDSITMNSLRNSFVNLKSRLPQELIDQEARMILTSMKQIDKADNRLQVLANHLSSLGDNLSEELAIEGVKLIFEKYKIKKDLLILMSLKKAFISLIEYVPRAEVLIFFKQILFDMKEFNYDQFRILDHDFFEPLIEKLLSSQASAVATQITTIFQDTKGYEYNLFQKLSLVLRMLKDKLPQQQTNKIAKQIVIAMHSINDPRNIGNYISCLISLGERLEENQTEAAANIIIDHMNNGKNLTTLIHAMGILKNKLSEQKVSEGVRVIISNMRKMQDSESYQLFLLANALDQLKGKIPEQQKNEAAKIILTAMRKSRDFKLVSKLSHSLKSLVNKDFVTQELLEWLKCPNAVGKDRKDILEYCGLISGKKFESIHSFSTWVRKNRSLDLVSSPENPFVIVR